MQGAAQGDERLAEVVEAGTQLGVVEQAGVDRVAEGGWKLGTSEGQALDGLADRACRRRRGRAGDRVEAGP
jgi:hypothetical protein